MITRIISILLHHANRICKAPEFYIVKTKVLKKYGKLIGHDVQYFTGVRCNSCGGTGQHPKYSWTTGKIYDYADCYHCFWGWYKLPTWVILEKYRLGKYSFHQPIKKVYSKKEIDVENYGTIEGYVIHKDSKHGYTCLLILYILFDFKRWIKVECKSIGRSYYYNWFTPYRFINNIIHFLKYQYKAFPIQNLKRKLNQKTKPKVSVSFSDTEDLPF